MKARLALGKAYCAMETKTSVALQMEEYVEMVRLDRDDFAQLRSVIPGLMLRVGQDQRCYDYLKWWAWVYKSEDPCDREIPWLCMKKANAFEDTKKIAARWSDLQQLVAFTVLKVKLLMDVMKLQNLTNWANANLVRQARLQKVVGFDALKAGIDALVCLRQEGGWNLARSPNSTSNLRLYLSYRFIAFNTRTIKSTYFVLKDKREPTK
jgi:hypothetical protein